MKPLNTSAVYLTASMNDTMHLIKDPLNICAIKIPWFDENHRQTPAAEQKAHQLRTKGEV